MVVLLMGVTGVGKSTVGLALAEYLHWKVVDADGYQPAANVAKMRAGVALDDSDRAPWLAALHEAILAWLDADRNVVLACSALKRSYRQQLTVSPAVRLVYLRGTPQLIAHRLSERHGHYMDAGLLASQLEVLEEPEQALVVDIDAAVPDIVAQIRRGLSI